MMVTNLNGTTGHRRQKILHKVLSKIRN